MAPPAVRAVYLVRHAAALNRAAWSAPDRDRPLSVTGRAQAEALAQRVTDPSVSGWTVGRILSSPALRCRETLQPTAARAGVPVDELAALAEGGDPAAALDELVAASLRTGDGAAIVACSHGDVIGGILESLGHLGVAVDAPLAAPKAATWRFTIVDGRLSDAHFIAPPL